ncbi:MAG: hypothetical protein ACOCUF_03485 [Patescibacteria group bacterium]
MKDFYLIKMAESISSTGVNGLFFYENEKSAYLLTLDPLIFNKFCILLTERKLSYSVFFQDQTRVAETSRQYKKFIQKFIQEENHETA